MPCIHSLTITKLLDKGKVTLTEVLQAQADANYDIEVENKLTAKLKAQNTTSVIEREIIEALMNDPRYTKTIH